MTKTYLERNRERIARVRAENLAQQSRRTQIKSVHKKAQKKTARSAAVARRRVPPRDAEYLAERRELIVGTPQFTVGGNIPVSGVDGWFDLPWGMMGKVSFEEKDGAE